ncbi:MAG: hypothetical protein HYT88_05685, partial [Candidatus Omnitrophica bacterium]|nr:hypothetical protein [Candidatus Omnitrophota bacterium]
AASVNPEDIRHYFALDLPLSDILDSFDVDAQIHQAIQDHRGLRILRQEGWETLASFICSAFNNIKRIKGMLERLCQAFGEPVAFNGFRTFAFPSAEILAATSERQLRSLGLGYRAHFLRATARRVADGQIPLSQLAQADYESAKRALLGCNGVGEKVADCVALFGLGHYEAFPVDVWMERAMRYYFRNRRVGHKKMHLFARRHFGSYAGWAQQYLYHYVRNYRSANSTQHSEEDMGHMSDTKLLGHGAWDMS